MSGCCLTAMVVNVMVKRRGQTASGMDGGETNVESVRRATGKE